MASPSLKSHGRGLLVCFFFFYILFNYSLISTDDGNQIFVSNCSGETPGDYTDLKLNNPDISVEDGTLNINNIQKTNEGYYLCEAVNGIGSGLSAVILISVQGKKNLVKHFVKKNICVTYSIFIDLFDFQLHLTLKLSCEIKQLVVANQLCCSVKHRVRSRLASCGI